MSENFRLAMHEKREYYNNSTHCADLFTESGPFLARGAHGIERGYEIGRAVCIILARSDRRLVDVHGVGVLEARVVGGGQVHHHEVVLEEDHYSIGLLEVCRKKSDFLISYIYPSINCEYPIVMSHFNFPA